MSEIFLQLTGVLKPKFQAVSLLEGLLEHGRLSFTQMVQRAKNKGGTNQNIGTERDSVFVNQEFCPRF